MQRSLLRLARALLPGRTPTGSLNGVTPTSAGGKQVTLQVDGMHCEVMCARRVRDIVIHQPGVNEAEVDFEAKTITVNYNDEIFKLEDAITALTAE